MTGTSKPIIKIITNFPEDNARISPLIHSRIWYDDFLGISWDRYYNLWNNEKHKQLILDIITWNMSEIPEELVKITSGGTISIPRQFRKYLEMQKGDYVKVGLEGDHVVVRKVQIS